MKKVLEDELMSLAHRILKLRNRAEIHELKEEAAVLYEKLAVLSFAEKHFEGAKPTIKKFDVEKSIEQATEEEEDVSTNYPDGTEYNEEQIYEHNTEKIKDIVSQMPYESSQVDRMFEENDEEENPSQNISETEHDIQDFGVHFDDLPDFEPAENKDESDSTTEKRPPENTTEDDSKKDEDDDEKTKRTNDLFPQQKKSLNDSLNQELKIGLNDRLSFIINLFLGNKEEYLDFINKINELESFEEAKAFLNEKIQKKYSFWKDKEEIANRLLYLIQKKFE